MHPGLSPYLFNTYTMHIMREAIDEEDGISIHGRQISNLRYADDTVLILNTAEGLQSLVNKVTDESSRHGLHLNVSKTKVMAVGRNRVELQTQLADAELEQIDSYKYLGARITEDGSCQLKVRSRLSMDAKVGL